MNTRRLLYFIAADVDYLPKAVLGTISPTKN